MCATQLVPRTSLLHTFLNLVKTLFMPCYAASKFVFILFLHKYNYFPQMNFLVEFIIIFTTMSDVSLSSEGISQRFTLILWMEWKTNKQKKQKTKKENHYIIKFNFLFEAPDNFDIKLVSSVQSFPSANGANTLTAIDSFLITQENLKQKMEKLNLYDFWFRKVMLYLVICKYIYAVAFVKLTLGIALLRILLTFEDTLIPSTAGLL